MYNLHILNVQMCKNNFMGMTDFGLTLTAVHLFRYLYENNKIDVLYKQIIDLLLQYMYF